jgi:hypothetical protein
LDIVVVIPSTVIFIASDAFGNVSQISIADGDFCLDEELFVWIQFSRL